MTTAEILEIVRRSQICAVRGSPEWVEDKGWLTGVEEIELHNGVILYVVDKLLGIELPEGLE